MPVQTDSGLTGYTGTTGETYSADSGYLPSYGGCNGWVLNASMATSMAASGVPSDAGCGTSGGRDPAGGSNPSGTAWWWLGQMAIALGEAQGMDATAAAGNAVLSSETNHANQTQPAGLQFATNLAVATPAATAIPGHYYEASIWVAAAHCTTDPSPSAAWQDPSQQLDLLAGTDIVDSVSGINICNAAATYTTSGGTPIHTMQIAVAPFQVNNAGALSMQVSDITASGNGNDVALDTPQIWDVTPQLDKAFSPTTITAGETSTLTLTITNTYGSDGATLQAKPDMSFTDTLPSNLTVAATQPTDPGTCVTDTGDNQMTVTAVPGSGSVSVSGDLGAVASCTINVNVTSDVAGSYVNGPDQGSFGDAADGGYSGLTGLWAPSDATLTVNAAPVPTTTSSTATPPTATQSQSPVAPPAGPAAATGGSLTGSMVLWPMLALIVIGAAAWLANWRRKLATV